MPGQLGADDVVAVFDIILNPQHLSTGEWQQRGPRGVQPIQQTLPPAPCPDHLLKAEMSSRSVAKNRALSSGSAVVTRM